jgi:hypothetical protein
MENFRRIETNFLNALCAFDTSSKESTLSTFGNLWMSDDNYFEHYEKRRNEKNERLKPLGNFATMRVCKGLSKMSFKKR